MAEDSRTRRAVDALSEFEGEQDPLRRLDAARRAREATARLERDQVKAARRAGATWTEIGRLYGLTKQGAQQRFRDGS